MGGKVGQFAGGVTYVPGQIHEYVNSGFVTGIADEFQGVVIPALDHLNIYDPSIKPLEPATRAGIMPFFLGFEGEDIMTAEVFCCKVFDEDLLNKTRINEHLTYDASRLDAIDYCKNYTNTGHNQFDKYYRHGMWDYYLYLPDAQITSATIAPEDIEAAIKADYGDNSVFIDRISLGVPSEKDWIRHWLQEVLNYDIAKDLYKASNGSFYKYGSHTYDRNTGKFTVTMTPYRVVKAVEYWYERSIKSIGMGTWSYYQTTYKRYPQSSEVYDADTYKVLGTLPQNDPAGWQLVALNEVITVQGDNYGEGMGTSYDLNAVEPVDTPQYNRDIEVPGIPNGMYYTVHYRTDIDDVKFWIQKLNVGSHPELSKAVSTLKEFDMFPLTCLRTVFRFIHDWPDNEEKTEQTKELIGHIGLDYDTLIDGISQSPSIGDVRDVFFGIGVSPSNTSWAVSAALYESLNWMLNILPPNIGSFENPTAGTTRYGVSFQERPFNSTLFFQYRSDAYVEGRYHSTVTDKDLWESEYSHMVQKIRVRVRTIYHVQGITMSDVGSDNSNYRIIVNQIRVEIQYSYSDENWKTYSRYAGTLPGFMCLCTGGEDNECEGRCEKYRGLPHWGGMGRIDWDKVPFYAIVHSDELQDTHLLRVVHQIHRNRYRYIDIVDVQQTYIIQDRGETAVKNVYPGSDKFVFPLSVEVVQKLTLMEKTYLLGESCYLFFYAVQWQHLEWYETSAFGTFLGFISFVITAVITVVSLGSMSWASMTATQALMQILKQVAISVALNLALKAIDALIDNPLLKTALSVAAMAAASIGSSYLGNGMKFDFKLDFGSAVSMCKLPMKAFEIYTGAMFKQEAMELAKQQEALTSAYNERMSEISAAMEALGSGIDTSFLANLLSNSDYQQMSSAMILPQDYYATAFSNNTPETCSRMQFCQLTVKDFVKNSIRLR